MASGTKTDCLRGTVWVECGEVSVTDYARPVYRIFGLPAASDIALPALVVDDAPAARIVSAPLAPEGQRLWHDETPVCFDCYRDDAGVFLVWQGAQFHVTADRVVVDASRHTDAAELLVPAVWSVLLALRGRPALHGCAVEQDGRAIAVLGVSGSGKSTAALALLDRGWRLVTDDLLTFDAAGNAIPGPPFVRVELPRLAGRSVLRSSGGKRRVPVVSCPKAVPLAGVVVLADKFASCDRLTGAAAALALLGQVYSPLPIDPDQPKRLLELATALAESIPVYGAPPRSLDADHLARIAKEAAS